MHGVRSAVCHDILNDSVRDLGLPQAVNYFVQSSKRVPSGASEAWHAKDQG